MFCIVYLALIAPNSRWIKRFSAAAQHLIMVHFNLSPLIRKIAYDENMEKRYVTTVLGTSTVHGTDDGSPDIALFNGPQDISYDGNGGYWIAMRYEPALRKYSIE